MYSCYMYKRHGEFTRRLTSLVLLFLRRRMSRVIHAGRFPQRPRQVGILGRLGGNDCALSFSKLVSSGRDDMRGFLRACAKLDFDVDRLQRMPEMELIRAADFVLLGLFANKFVYYDEILRQCEHVSTKAIIILSQVQMHS